MRFTQITFRRMPRSPAIGERIRDIPGKPARRTQAA
jgi:hypothetical protein